MLRTKLRNMALLHTLYRSVVMSYKRKRYRLKNVHRTFFMNGRSFVSRDLVAHEFSSIGPECCIGSRVELGPYVMFARRCFPQLVNIARQNKILSRSSAYLVREVAAFTEDFAGRCYELLGTECSSSKE